MFFEDISKLRIFVKPGPTDGRKAIHGLSVMVQETMQLQPLDGSLFLFTNRRRNVLKILYWDKNGFCLWVKKLEKHKFPWINTGDKKYELNPAQLRWLLRGIDFFKAHEELKYSRVI